MGVGIRVKVGVGLEVGVGVKVGIGEGHIMGVDMGLRGGAKAKAKNPRQ